MKLNMKNRRGVGGLISLVGLIAVFGIVATAFVELSLGQADFMGTTVDVNKLLIDKNNELLNFTTHVTANNVTVQNLWSKSSTINCYLLINIDGKIIDDRGCPDKKIDAGKKQNITNVNFENIDELIFTTNLGKKCLIIVDRGHGLC